MTAPSMTTAPIPISPWCSTVHPCSVTWCVNEQNSIAATRSRRPALTRPRRVGMRHRDDGEEDDADEDRTPAEVARHRGKRRGSSRSRGCSTAGRCAAEHSTAVQLAHADDMDTAMTITYQSSLQIALFVARCWCSGARRWGCSGVAQATHLDLVFTPLEVVSVMLTVLTVVVFGMSGRTSWFEGVPLLGLYLILGSRSSGASSSSAVGRAIPTERGTGRWSPEPARRLSARSPDVTTIELGRERCW
jgi:Sodium/calcium exchanger protein